MARDELTQQDIDRLDWLLNEQGDRTAFYLHYYELTGNQQVLDMAKISQLTDFEGAVAERANEVVQNQHPDQYPQGGVFEFSREVALHLYDAITKDFNEGSGTGVLAERAVLESARDAWDARGLGDQFPGNPLLAAELASAGDLKGAWDAFNSPGTDIAVEAAAYAAIPDISGNPHPGIQDRLENATYHLTEDGKAGYYIDRETGHVVAVFDRPADLATEPQIQSQGILNTFTPPEPQLPATRDDYDSSVYQPTNQGDHFDGRHESPGVSPFAAGMMGYALGHIESDIPNAHIQPESPTPLPDAFSSPFSDSQPIGFFSGLQDQSAPAVLPEPVHQIDEPEPQGRDFFSGIRDAVWGQADTTTEAAAASETATHQGSGWGGFLSGLQDFALDGGPQTQQDIVQAVPDVYEVHQPDPTAVQDNGWFSNAPSPWSDNNSPPDVSSVWGNDSSHQDHTPPVYDTHVESYSPQSESSGHTDLGGSDGGGSHSGSDGGGGGDAGDAGGGGDS